MLFFRIKMRNNGIELFQRGLTNYDRKKSSHDRMHFWKVFFFYLSLAKIHLYFWIQFSSIELIWQIIYFVWKYPIVFQLATLKLELHEIIQQIQWICDVKRRFIQTANFFHLAIFFAIHRPMLLLLCFFLLVSFVLLFSGNTCFQLVDNLIKYI